MIYKMNLLKKELSYGYYQKRDGLKQLIGLGTFLGMLAFSVYFVMQTLTQSVLTDDAPYFMRPSYFSTTFLYLVVSGIGFLIYFEGKFSQVSFAEVYDNSWYCMAHLKYPVWAMVLSKLFAQIVSVIIIYTTGFVVTLLLSSVLKFPLVIEYLFSQYFLGLINAAVILVLVMLLSMLGRDRANAKSWVSFLALAIFLLQFPSGFYAIATDLNRMKTFRSMWTGSWYLWMVLGCTVVALMVCIRRGARIANMFNPPAETCMPQLTSRLGADVHIVLRTESRNAYIRKLAKRLKAAYQPARRFNLLSFLSTFALIVTIVFMLSVNLALLAFSYASPEKETSVMGFIPYIFQSTTMEPTVYYNDIAFFEKIDGYVKVDPGDIVLYKDDVGVVQVRKILSFYVDEKTGEERVNADITNYVEGAEKDALKTTLARSQVYGRLVGTNRYLGAVVLFANTMIGRLLFLLIPTILIFFSGPILGLIRQFGKTPFYGEIGSKPAMRGKA